MLQARFTLSFHCFSVRLMYLDLQLAMLVSTDCSADIWSSWLPRGLYHVVKRSTSLAYTNTQHKNIKQHICLNDTSNRSCKRHSWEHMRLYLTSRARSSVLRFMKYLCSCVPLFVFFDRPERENWIILYNIIPRHHQGEKGEDVRSVCVRTWFFGESGDSTGQRVRVDPALCDRLSGAHGRVQTAPGVIDRHHRQTVHRHILRIWHNTQTQLHFIWLFSHDKDCSEL